MLALYCSKCFVKSSMRRSLRCTRCSNLFTLICKIWRKAEHLDDIQQWLLIYDTISANQRLCNGTKRTDKQKVNVTIILQQYHFHPYMLSWLFSAEVDETSIRCTVTEFLFLSIEMQTVAVIKLQAVECVAETVKIALIVGWQISQLLN